MVRDSLVVKRATHLGFLLTTSILTLQATACWQACCVLKLPPGGDTSQHTQGR